MPSVAIVTRNAMHGGVETMIAMHQKYFEASVYAAGGYEFPETCPFPYTYVGGTDIAQAQAQLTALLSTHDVILYHWPLWWALDAIRAAGKPSIEAVHRDDTNDCDKNLPTLIVTHSQFLADVIARDCGREAIVIAHGVDVDRFPDAGHGPYVGGITSYYHPVKGLDLFFEAWRRLQPRFPGRSVRFYGSGKDLPVYQRMVDELRLDHVELLGPVVPPEPHFAEFRLFVQPSRLEGMPFALLEALACSVPVVCSDLPGMVEFNRVARERGVPEPLVLFRTGDVDDLADKIAAQLSRDDVPTPTRRYVRDHYGAEQHCRAYAIAIGRALEAHRQRPAHAAAEAQRMKHEDTVQALRARLAERELALEALSAKLTDITGSRGWAWVRRYRRLRSWLRGRRDARPADEAHSPERHA